MALSDVTVKAISANGFNEGAAVMQSPRGGFATPPVLNPQLPTNSSNVDLTKNLANFGEKFDDPTYYTA